MNCLVTGAAGFIGSHLCEALLYKGHRVLGIDAFRDNYDPNIKRANATTLIQHPNFQLFEMNLLDRAWSARTGAIDWVFHLAARPGVRTSWGDDFSNYCDDNILATQRLLEVCLTLKPLKIVFSSSSSVYGNAEHLPVKESCPTQPISPYGATKLSGEHLCRIYQSVMGLPISVLRYFTVFGPRQRPDMAFSRWISAVITDEPIHIFGDGLQTRDFTFIADCVKATMLTAEKGIAGKIYNIAGGSQASPRDVLHLLTEISGKTPTVAWEEAKKGDPRHTSADTTLAQHDLGFKPQTRLREGLAQQFEVALSGK